MIFGSVRFTLPGYEYGIGKKMVPLLLGSEVLEVFSQSQIYGSTLKLGTEGTIWNENGSMFGSSIREGSLTKPFKWYFNHQQIFPIVPLLVNKAELKYIKKRIAWFLFIFLFVICQWKDVFT